MLSAGDLSSAIISNMSNANNPASAHGNFSNAIQNYIKPNIEIAGTYVGLLPVGSADPSNGNYKWKATVCVISAPNLQLTARGGLSSWISGMKVEFAKISIVGSDTLSKITTTAPALLLPVSMSISFNFGTDKPTMDKAMSQVAPGIVNCLKSCLLNPVYVPAISTTAGTGIVTWTGVS
jgi:hypothetical protein